MRPSTIAIHLFLFGLAATALALTPSSALGDAPRASYGRDACTSGEHWVFSGAIFEANRDEFTSFLRGHMAPVRGFSEAFAMRRFATNAETQRLGEYWISRALYDAKLAHIAFGGFANIASRPVDPATAGIQLSALDCLLQIQAHYPSIELPAPVVERLSSLKGQATNPHMLDVIYRAAGSALRAELPKNPAHADELISLLKGSGAYEDFARALKAEHQNNPATAVAALERFFLAPSTPPSLKRYGNAAHLLMARSLYSLGRFDQASAHLRLITKSSNELAEALGELSWAQLMGDHLKDAVGTGMTLQAGGLRHTYAPEAPMVMAMALNELCQYPDSVRAINMFRRDYEKSYEWLRKGLSASENNLYPLAVKFVRKTQGMRVPDRVAGEWIRSPIFLADQEELNLLFDERDSTTALGRSGAREQSKLAQAIMHKAKNLPQRLRKAKAKMRDGDHLPSGLISDMLALKELIIHYRRLQQGAPIWHAILTNYRKTVPATESRLIASVNGDLKGRSLRMLSQLEEIAENIQLIEVEIYNGASQDIIWKNAHPDYQKVADQITSEQRREQAERTLDWGRTPASFDEDGAEVWEDELGSFSANLYDNCQNKDRYLALKMGR